MIVSTKRRAEIEISGTFLAAILEKGVQHRATWEHQLEQKGIHHDETAPAWVLIPRCLGEIRPPFLKIGTKKKTQLFRGIPD